MVNSKDKGKRGERELAAVFRDAGFSSARRGQQFKGGPESPDLIVEELSWLHVECKYTERLELYKALKQASGDASEEQIPAVFHRKNNEDWIVALSARDFFTILKLRS